MWYESPTDLVPSAIAAYIDLHVVARIRRRENALRFLSYLK